MGVQQEALRPEVAGIVGFVLYGLFDLVRSLIRSRNGQATDSRLQETMDRLAALLERQAQTDERTAALLEQVVRGQERVAEELGEVHRLASRTLDAVRLNERRVADG